MIAKLNRLNTLNLPYTLHLYGVPERRFDELVDEETRADLIDGVMIVHSPASPQHDDLAGFVRTLMRCYAEENELGRVFGPDALIHLATGRKVGPDAFFFVEKRAPRPRPEKEFEEAPDLVLEVLSPSNRDVDLEDKRPVYQEAGVKEIWLIDPDNQEVIVDRRRGQQYTTKVRHKGRLTSSVLSGFWLEASWLWADPLPNVMTCLREILG
jgi:Uma2 family endonuclease